MSHSEVEDKFVAMMLGVELSNTLKDDEKKYIIEMLKDQLRLEHEAIEFNKAYYG